MGGEGEGEGLDSSGEGEEVGPGGQLQVAVRGSGGAAGEQVRHFGGQGGESAWTSLIRLTWILFNFVGIASSWLFYRLFFP